MKDPGADRERQEAKGGCAEAELNPVDTVIDFLARAFTLRGDTRERKRWR